jgi:hypothetical protein
MATKLEHHGLRQALGGVALLTLAGCAPQPQVAQAPPGQLAAGQARIWLYRDYEPSISRGIANVDLNGARFASVPPYGGPTYRDVAPGHYHLSVESFDVDVGQSSDVDLAPGQELFAKVLADNTRIASGDTTEFVRPTFYLRLIPPGLARGQISANRS